MLLKNPYFVGMGTRIRCVPGAAASAAPGTRGRPLTMDPVYLFGFGADLGHGADVAGAECSAVSG